MERMSGLIAEGERKAGTTMTVSPDTLEPFAFHAAFVGVATLHHRLCADPNSHFRGWIDLYRRGRIDPGCADRGVFFGLDQALEELICD